MKTIYLCTPHKLGQLNYELIDRIKKLGFQVTSAATDTPQNQPRKQIFHRNVDLIKDCDIFVAVFNNYGKDLTAEVGMAYAWKKPSLGIDYNAQETDAMSYYALDRIVKPEELDEALKELT